MSAEQTSYPPRQPSVGGHDGGDAAAAQRAVAVKLIGLLFGVALLIGCAFAVSHLSSWGEKGA